MKVKELFEAGLLGQFLGGLAGKSARQVDYEQRQRQAEKMAKAELKKQKTQSATDNVDTTPVKTKTAQPKDTSPKDNPNANLNSKIDYLKKEGVIQSGRITDDEKRYIDSVDVYIDPNRFNNEDPDKKLIKSQPPHHMNYQTSVQIPMKDWQEALGRSGQGLSGYVSFDLTPAGWWSDDFKAYVNPNNPLDDIVTGFQK
jgi:hypothetical protein